MVARAAGELRSSCVLVSAERLPGCVTLSHGGQMPEAGILACEG